MTVLGGTRGNPLLCFCGIRAKRQPERSTWGTISSLRTTYCPPATWRLYDLPRDVRPNV